MKRIFVLLIAFIISGCAGAPPKPATVNGTYYPINKLDTTQQNLKEAR